jgi:hypothetical protein
MVSGPSSNRPDGSAQSRRLPLEGLKSLIGNLISNQTCGGTAVIGEATIKARCCVDCNQLRVPYRAATPSPLESSHDAYPADDRNY